MNTNRLVAAWFSAAILLVPASGAHAANAGPSAIEPVQKGEPGSVNPPTAAEPMKPGTLDRPPQAVAPGTRDSPPKPIAPGTLDRNVINPDVQIQRGEKPVPR